MLAGTARRRRGGRRRDRHPAHRHHLALISGRTCRFRAPQARRLAARSRRPSARTRRCQVGRQQACRWANARPAKRARSPLPARRRSRPAVRRQRHVAGASSQASTAASATARTTWPLGNENASGPKKNWVAAVSGRSRPTTTLMTNATKSEARVSATRMPAARPRKRHTIAAIRDHHHRPDQRPAQRVDGPHQVSPWHRGPAPSPPASPAPSPPAPSVAAQTASSRTATSATSATKASWRRAAATVTVTSRM